jgi:DNA methylase
VTDLAQIRSAPLGSLEMAERALAQAKELPDVARLVAGAEVMRVYARKARLSLDAQNDWSWFKIRAQRKGGAFLADAERGEAGRPVETMGPTTGPISPYQAALKAAELAKQRAAEWQRLAAIPGELLDEYRAERRNEKFQELTLADFLRYAERKLREDAADNPPPPTVVLDEDACRIIHGDFREALADLEPGSVDAIITDPPYPFEYVDLYVDLSQLAAKVVAPGGVLAVMCGQYHLPDYIDRLSAAMRYRWCGAYVAQGPRTRVHAAKVGTGWKPILLYQQHDAPRDELRFVLDDLFDSEAEDKLHNEWGQSESGMAVLVDRLTLPGALVVDPFLGAGTTAVVCRDLGRRFIGCDVDQAAITRVQGRLA